MAQPIDQHYLLRALSLAKAQRGYCAPNPSVGAVIVKHGSIIAEGCHLGPNTDHAESQVLKQLDTETANHATLYVTLEPCCHYGRTPPCTDNIIQKGISRVVIGAVDPNPRVRFQGIQQMRNAGIVCEQVTMDVINQFYYSYRHWLATGLPFVTTKLAMTLDGKIADVHGNPIQITSKNANRLTHEYRNHSDAILTTSQTILADNPKLNARGLHGGQAKDLYVLDTNLRTPSDAAIFDHAKSVTIFYHHSEIVTPKISQFTYNNLIHVDKHDGNGLKLDEVLKWIGNHGVHDLWVEAGGQLLSALIEQGLADRSLFYIGLSWQGSGQPAFHDKLSFEKANKVSWSDLTPDGLCTINWNDSDVYRHY